MSSRLPFHMLDPGALADGNYALEVVGGAIAGLVPSAAGGGGGGGSVLVVDTLPGAGAAVDTLAVVRPTLAGNLADYRAAVLADAPWGYWEQAETSGTMLADASGNARTVNIVSGAPVLAQPGPSDAKAIAWPTNSYGQTAVTLDEPTTSTYEAWIYLTAAPGQVTPILVVAPTFGASGNTSGLALEADGRVTAYHYPGAAISSPTPLALDQWHHVVVSTGAAGSKVRVNKATVVSSGTTSDMNAGNGPLWFHAYRNGASIVNGGPVTVALPAFWTSQLSNTATDAHYDALNPVGAPPELWFSNGVSWHQLA